MDTIEKKTINPDKVKSMLENAMEVKFNLPSLIVLAIQAFIVASLYKIWREAVDHRKALEKEEFEHQDQNDQHDDLTHDPIH